jgi:hypothetical protein
MQRATQHAAHHATCDVRRKQQKKDLQGEHDHGLKLQITLQRLARTYQSSGSPHETQPANIPKANAPATYQISLIRR